MNNNKIQINLYIEDRCDSVIWTEDQVSLDLVHEVITFITNEIKQKYQTDDLHLRDQENQYYEIPEVVDFLRPHTFITIPHNHEIKTKTALEERELRSLYKLTEEECVIEKYKGKRKTETVTYKMQTIKNLNNQYLETLKKLLDNDIIIEPRKRLSLVTSTQSYAQKEEQESPKFGQSQKKQQQDININQDHIREAGNDGVSPSWILKKAQSQKKLTLKPVTLKELTQHNQQHDAWICINQKVYDVTFYLNKHPGGLEKLMEGVGTDGTGLFMKHHPWVNAHYLLESFQVGFLINK